MHWFYLTLAILCEVFATTMLKLSNGFSKLWPTVGVTVGYAVSFWAVAFAMKTIPLGTAYAVWSGLGLVLTAIISVYYFGQKIDTIGIISILLILIGVVLMNTLSSMSGH